MLYTCSTTLHKEFVECNVSYWLIIQASHNLRVANSLIGLTLGQRGTVVSATDL